ISCNYKSSYCLDTKKELKDLFENIEIVENPSLIVINVKRGSRENLGRPKTTPIENKEYFMNQM
ncbi:MAG: phosphonopyruvate decarboxylase, partial [Candidatus Heimdallarchaeota archaeon]|nr:phosphonopyruvate decarboxylase [Candidatus Heimdallarchaeota archaeon]